MATETEQEAKLLNSEQSFALLKSLFSATSNIPNVKCVPDNRQFAIKAMQVNQLSDSELVQIYASAKWNGKPGSESNVAMQDDNYYLDGVKIQTQTLRVMNPSNIINALIKQIGARTFGLGDIIFVEPLFSEGNPKPEQEKLRELLAEVADSQLEKEVDALGGYRIPQIDIEQFGEFKELANLLIGQRWVGVRGNKTYPAASPGNFWQIKVDNDAPVVETADLMTKIGNSLERLGIAHAVPSKRTIVINPSEFACKDPKLAEVFKTAMNSIQDAIAHN